jgi:hypothetical protein
LLAAHVGLIREPPSVHENNSIDEFLRQTHLESHVCMHVSVIFILRNTMMSDSKLTVCVQSSVVICDMYYSIWLILFIGLVSAQKCIPLTGDSPATNPYHEYLIGYDLGSVSGSGNPIYITDPFRARQDFDMSFSIEKTVSTETSIQISSSVNTQKVSISEISDDNKIFKTYYVKLQSCDLTDKHC